MTNEEMLKQFQGLCDQMYNLMRAKNADYSTGEDPFKNLRRHGQYGIVVRLDDKLSRLDTFTNPKHGAPTPQVRESLEDTALDVAVYALLLIMLGRGDKPLSPKIKEEWAA